VGVEFNLGLNDMNRRVKIGIIGDLDANHPSRIATDSALNHAAAALSVAADCAWVSTLRVEREGAEEGLAAFNGLWCAPGSPYKRMEGALGGIRFARERDRPFVAT
jgi:CTP synthase (UTP-ammonia lyase)